MQMIVSDKELDDPSHMLAIGSGKRSADSLRVCRNDRGVGVFFQAQLLAATNILHGVARGVPGSSRWMDQQKFSKDSSCSPTVPRLETTLF